MSSRAGFEIVQKARIAGISAVVALGAWGTVHPSTASALVRLGIAPDAILLIGDMGDGEANDVYREDA